ncbi:MAG: hypothetical protein ACI4LM_01595 [Anaerovoracaceae bacterium]
MNRKKLLKGISIGAPLMLLLGLGKKRAARQDRKITAVHPSGRVKKMTIDSDQVAVPEVHINTENEEAVPADDVKAEAGEAEGRTRDHGLVDDDEVALPLPKVKNRKRKKAAAKTEKTAQAKTVSKEK